MLFVHDTSVIRAGQRVAAVKGGNLPGQKRQQPVMNVPVHEHIIRRDAGLAAHIAALRANGEVVVELLPGETACEGPRCDRKLVRLGQQWIIEAIQED